MMTVTVWFRGDVDEVFENVQSISSLRGRMVQINFMEDGRMQNKIIYLDGETSIMIDAEQGGGYGN